MKNIISSKVLVYIIIVCIIVGNIFFINDFIGRRYEKTTVKNKESSNQNLYNFKYDNKEELNSACKSICQETQEEGTVLLLNLDDVLPINDSITIKIYPLENNKRESKFKNVLLNYGYKIVDENEEVAIVTLYDSKKRNNSFTKDEVQKLKEIKQKKEQGEINKIILVIETNVLFPIMSDYVETYGIDGCVWAGDNCDYDGLINILSGRISPSGKLVETIIQDNTFSPSYINRTLQQKEKKNYILQEGIYIGYKYYETRYSDYCKEIGNTQDYKYRNSVLYPFGYGLSYTKFEYSNLSAEYDNNMQIFRLSVDVKNVGDTYSGKEVVQVYLQSPYTEYDIENFIEKSAVSLVGYGKTDVLKPGETQRLSIEVREKDLVSFDVYGLGTYIIEQGDYFLTVAANAHDAANNFLAANNLSIEKTNGRMDNEGNAKLVCSWREKSTNATSYSNSNVGNIITASNNIENEYNHVKYYLSRRDWNQTWPSDEKIVYIQQEMGENLQNGIHNEGNTTINTKKTNNSDALLSLYDVTGKTINDTAWNELLSQIDDRIGSRLIVSNSLKINAEPSIRLPEIKIYSEKKINELLTSNRLMTSTFNTEMIKKNGNIISEICNVSNVSHIVADGNQINSILSNTNSYSEDSYLTGHVSGIKYNEIELAGINITINDFLYGNELGRSNYIINEQALRETYLKVLEYPIELNRRNGINLTDVEINGMHINENIELIKKIYRLEWGSEGIIMTESNRIDMNPEEIVEAGVSLIISDIPFIKTRLKLCKNDGISTAINEAIKYNLNTVSNSIVMNEIGSNSQVIYEPTLMFYFELIIAIAFDFLSVILLLLLLKKRKVDR